MNTIETIRAEVERLKKKEIELMENSTKKYGDYPPSSDIMLVAYQNVLSFLSDLEKEEKPMNQDGLEEEIERWCYENVDESGFYNMVDYARHFAQWGAEHANKNK